MRSKAGLAYFISSPCITARPWCERSMRCENWSRRRSVSPPRRLTAACTSTRPSATRSTDAMPTCQGIPALPSTTQMNWFRPSSTMVTPTMRSWRPLRHSHASATLALSVIRVAPTDCARRGLQASAPAPMNTRPTAPASVARRDSGRPASQAAPIIQPARLRAAATSRVQSPKEDTTPVPVCHARKAGALSAWTTNDAPSQ